MKRESRWLNYKELGVRKGKMCPLLGNIYINDILDEVKNSNTQCPRRYQVYWEQFRLGDYRKHYFDI